VLPLGAWLAFPWWAPPVAGMLLGQQGLDLKALELSRPAWRRITIDKLQLQDASGLELTLLSNELLVLRAFQQFELHTSELKLVRHPAGLEEKRTDSYPTALLSEYLPSTLLKSLPELRLRLAHFSYQEADSLVLRAAAPTELLLGPRGLSLSSQFELPLSEVRAPVDLLLEITDENTLKLQLEERAADPAKLQLNVSASAPDDQVSLTGELRLRDPAFVPLVSLESYDLKLPSLALETGFQISVKDLAISELIRQPQFSLHNTVALMAQDPSQYDTVQLNAKFDFSAIGERWELALDNVDTPRPLLQIRNRRQEEDHELSLRVDDKFALSGRVSSMNDIAIDTLNTPEKNNLRFTYRLNQERVAAADIHSIQWNGVIGPEADIALRFSSVLDGDVSKVAGLFKLQGVEWQALVDGLAPASFHLPMRVNLQSGNIQLAVQEGASISANQLKTASATLKKPRLKIPVQTIELNPQTLYPNKLSLALQAERLNTDIFTATSLAWQLELTQQKETVVAELKNHRQGIRFTPKGPEYSLPPYRIVAETKGDFINKKSAPGRVAFRLYNECNEVLLAGTLLDQQKLEMTVERTFSRANSLRNWLNLPQLTNDLVAGSLAAKMDWNFVHDRYPGLTLSLDKGNIEGDLGTFQGIQLSLSSETAESERRYNLNGEVKSVNVGLEASNFQFLLQAQPTEAQFKVLLERLEAEVFKGRVWVEEEKWVAGEATSIDIHIENLDIAEVIRSQNIDGLSTTGKLSGVQPMQLSAEGEFSLAKGTLSNTEKGVIRYQSELTNSPGVNQQLKFTMDVLEDFQYQRLQTETQYKDGNLLLYSKISGNNPSKTGGRTVDLNLNTEVELLPAFQVMRLQSGLEARVEKFFNPNSKVTNAAFCKAAN